MNKQLFKELESLRVQLESATEDESIKTYAKTHEKLMNNFDKILQGMEDGNYDEKDNKE